MIVEMTMRWLPWLFGGLCLLLTGCASGGAIDYFGAGGERWRLENPPKASAPAMLSRGNDGTVTATVSPPHRPDVAIGQLWLIPIIGTGLIVLGVGTLTLRSWLPSVPMGASLGAMATGAVLIAMPKLVQEAWWILALMLGGVAVTYGISWLDNRKKLSPIPQLKEVLT